MKIGRYMPTEDITDYMRSNADEWIRDLWKQSGEAKIILLSENDFRMLTSHPAILTSIRGKFIEVQNTSLFFPLIGLTIINRNMVKDYSIAPVEKT